MANPKRARSGKRLTQPRGGTYVDSIDLQNALERIRELKRSWYRALLRRSQRSRMNWQRMGRLVKRWLPAPRILHPYPAACVSL